MHFETLVTAPICQAEGCGRLIRRSVWNRPRKTCSDECALVYRRQKRRGYDVGRRRSGERVAPRPAAARYIVGVDGEGYDTPDGRHVYVYLCAADGRGRVVSEAYDPAGLSTERCRLMLLNIPRRTLLFGFMFSYDVTKIIEDLEPLERFRLMRPELRKRRRGKFRWRRRERGFDFFAGSLNLKEERARGTPRSAHVWDCFKFFGQSFVKALTAWDIGTPEERERIAGMKGKRGSFADEDIDEVKRYCADECRLLALLMTKVIGAHATAGIALKRFEGAGSSAAALLRKHDVARYRERITKSRRVVPKEVLLRMMQAYFGGRFENPHCRIFNQPMYGKDIRSAYPAAMRLLPCLRCGHWRETRKAKELYGSSFGLAELVVERMTERARARRAWQPLPFRDSDGSIVFPSGCRGWYHRDEAVVALSWPGVRFERAWIYETHCSHEPFAWVEEAYAARLAWGLDGPGLAMKLALNACYGRLAQRLGEGPFTSWLWAGAITAHTRAEILGALRPEAWDVVAVATDGVFSTRPLDWLHESTELGDWEGKHIDGLVLVKPGLYWPLRGEHEDKFRARGIGRREAFAHREAIEKMVRHWKGGETSVTIQSRRFFGAKASLYAMSTCSVCGTSYPGGGRCPKGHVPESTRVGQMRAPDGRGAYGRWCERDIVVSLDPFPKREALMGEGRLRIRDCDGRESAPYTGLTTPEGLELRELRELELEQPDWEGED